MRWMTWLIARYERLRDWWYYDPDAWLEEQLAINRFKYRPGMEFPDESIISRVGRERWDQTERAQRRLSR